MSTSWSHLGRPSLSAARLTRALAGRTWADIRIVGHSSSTNADVAAAARAGAAEGLVIIAEHQSAGRGRLDRSWQSPPRAGVTLSALLRPEVDVTRWGLLPLLAGVAIVDALTAVGGVIPRLKWPNDVLLGERKAAGILVERVGGAAVIGIGLNVSTTAAELPVGTATSLALAGGVTDREILAKELLRSLARRYVAWCDTAGGTAVVLPDYRLACATIGSNVTVDLPGGDVLRGVAERVDGQGRLVVRADSTGDEHRLSAGDVTHVRAGA